MGREERRRHNYYKAKRIVEVLRKMIDEPTDSGHDQHMVELLAQLLNHEDEPRWLR